VLIRNVRSTTQKDGLLFGGYMTGSEAQPPAPSIEYQGNSLHFEFSAVLYGQEQNIDYSYFLEGFDKDWSDWNRRPEKDYTNIPPGHYVFHVKCRNSVDNESPVTTYTFSILPPWYRSWWAGTLYCLLFCWLLYFFYKRQQRKYTRLQQLKLREQQRQYDEEQKQLQFQHQLEISKNEKEIIRLRNEKLQAEIEQKNLEEEQQRIQFEHQIEVEKNEKEIINLTNAKLQADIEGKNRELASNAMSFVQKGELLSKIKDELMRLKNGAETDKDKDFKKIIRTIDSELDNVHDWEQFAVHFDSVHTDYLKKLKETFPELTTSELKLCAYLRLNLTTKEISQLMNISIRGVETSRYRLRKKLDLPNEVHLSDFLLSYKP
jgi:DNA-binding CsgD family transcriptional regulator